MSRPYREWNFALVARGGCWWVGVHVDRHESCTDYFVLMMGLGVRIRTFLTSTALPIDQEDPLS